MQALWALTSSRGVFLLPLSRVLLTPFPPFPLTVFSTQLASSNTANSFTQQLNCLFAKNPFMEAVEKQDTHTLPFISSSSSYSISSVCQPNALKQFYTSTFVFSQVTFIMSLSNACTHLFLHLLSVHLMVFIEVILSPFSSFHCQTLVHTLSVSSVHHPHPPPRFPSTRSS